MDGTDRWDSDKEGPSGFVPEFGLADGGEEGLARVDNMSFVDLSIKGIPILQKHI